MTLLEKYPDAFEDEQGTIWISKQAAQDADWTFAHGDAFAEDIIGWSWENAEECWALCECEAKRREFWKSHPRMRNTWLFFRKRWGFTHTFLTTVWRDWYGRISWSTAWTMAGDIWLR